MTIAPDLPATDARIGTDCGCPEMRGLSRRGVLQGAGLAGLTYAVGSTVVSMSPAAAAGTASSMGTNTIVVLSLRGAADGLSLVVPHADPAYYASRPTIAIPKASLLAADSAFGLHPNLAPLLPLWNAGKLAAVHATGLAVANRSHFSAMEELEDADPGSKLRVGWLNRLLGTDDQTSPLQGLAVGDITTQFYGPQPVMSFSSLEEAEIAGDDKWDPTHQRVRSLHKAWDASKSPMAAAFRSTMAAVDGLAPAKAQADTSAAFPDTDLGRALASVSRTVRGKVGVGVVTVDQGDWDMHTDLGTLTRGRMIDNVTDLAGSIAAFFADLGPLADSVTLVTISEFGRRVVENSNAGLDHGWGNVMFLAGAGVKGGTYYGTWPGLKNSLDADLTVTTDYRSVLAEIVRTRTSASLATVFPGFTPTPIGAMRSS
ncbi:DUF1501 domain-containing protein [Nocardioides fonticola]|uniref:DUF1501 domain-containing protein n=1 Tax=Nocardioides fonticola TaxID=450363 RepID=A0ABP7XL79_9ACTN